MNAPLPRPRYERKFVAAGLSLAETLALVRQHPALFRVAYPARQVNNLYLDSPAMRDYLDHVHGAAHRLKTRIRWYGREHGRIPLPVLERKLKFGHVGGKESHPLPEITLDGTVPMETLDAAIGGAALPPLLRASLRHLQPVLINRYERHYFLSADGRFRLTVDTNLLFLGVRPSAGCVAALPLGDRSPVIELKYGPDHAAAAATIGNAIPFRMVRFSKYVLGIERWLALQN
ncbi:MAG TPA: polyphosphate polymerase domain-containing protein [Verrucomicrobiota bacterium]|nr:polyphosphate polymerase domain-containing protein [Verrucomicrobiota bacterium]HRZ38945.1 polyphosphate polymerase domain-containing protein [Candidatus Paceibacterota bacterium]HRZ58169.1 polyphosphate polymerase domain-containing protein [Candidatus Paceibacterota bacterium]